MHRFLVDVYKAETMRRFLVEWRLSQTAFQIQIGLKSGKLTGQIGFKS